MYAVGSTKPQSSRLQAGRQGEGGWQIRWHRARRSNRSTWQRAQRSTGPCGEGPLMFAAHTRTPERLVLQTQLHAMDSCRLSPYRRGRGFRHRRCPWQVRAPCGRDARLPHRFARRVRRGQHRRRATAPGGVVGAEGFIGLQLEQAAQQQLRAAGRVGCQGGVGQLHHWVLLAEPVVEQQQHDGEGALLGQRVPAPRRGEGQGVPSARAQSARWAAARRGAAANRAPKGTACGGRGAPHRNGKLPHRQQKSSQATPFPVSSTAAICGSGQSAGQRAGVGAWVEAGRAGAGHSQDGSSRTAHQTWLRCAERVQPSRHAAQLASSLPRQGCSLPGMPRAGHGQGRGKWCRGYSTRAPPAKRAQGGSQCRHRGQREVWNRCAACALSGACSWHQCPAVTQG